LVLTDINMSGALEGLELIRKVLQSYPAIKVIAASAYRISEPVEAAVIKPYSLQSLLTIIKSVLGR